MLFLDQYRPSAPDIRSEYAHWAWKGPSVSRGILVSAVILVTTGCHAPKTEVPLFTPKPRVEWGHITSRPVGTVNNEYKVLTAQQTQGLFPANLGVTRVSLETGADSGGSIEPRLYADPRNEFLQWNSALDNQMAVSEVFPIAQRDLGGGEADPDQILAAFRALHARLALLYAVNELSETHTEMFGCLYDTKEDKAIAAIHAEAVSVRPAESESEKEEPADLWETDSRALVRAKFAQLVHRCMRELIVSDKPAVLETPTGWTPAGPVRPAEWPPRHLRTTP